MTTCILSVESEGIAATYPETGEERFFGNLDDMREWAESLEEYEIEPVVMFSSSFDFPEEYTSEEWIIEFCEEVRSVDDFHP